MMPETHAAESIWTEFAGNACCEPSSLHVKELMSGKTLLITGAGGSIGSALARFADTCDVQCLVLLDSNEQSLRALERSFDSCSKKAHVSVLGNIGDSVWLCEVFALYHPQVILH